MPQVSLWLIFALPAIASTLTVVLVTPWVKRLAVRLGAIDDPGGRRIHGTATPRLGGLAIAIGAAIGVLVALRVPGIGRPGHIPLTVAFFATCGVLTLGFIDDLRQVPPL